MALWDTKYFQNRLRHFRMRISRNKQPPETKSDEEPKKVETLTNFTDSKPRQTGTAQEDEDVELGKMELCELELEAIIPYKVSSGLIVLGCFAASFVSIVTIRGILHDLPRVFQFFSNMYLAGTIICGD